MANTGERTWSRRQALGLIAVGGGALVGAKLTGIDPAGAIGFEEATGPVLVARGEDGLLFRLSFVNLEVRPATIFQGPKLALIDKTMRGYAVLTLRTQSVFEQTVFDDIDDGQTPAPAQILPAIASGDSRIVLRVEAGSDPLDYKLSTLLGLPLNVGPVADNGSGDALPLKPGPLDTAIEAPFRLFLSPTSAAAFSALARPVSRLGRSELWHARAVPINNKTGSVPFRAIWAADLPDGYPLDPLWAKQNATASLLPQERIDIVEATTRTGVEGKADPAEASLMLLSPMGASLNVRGKWPERLDIVAWRHRSTLGRDNYVKVDIPGFLLPGRIPAVKVRITERIHSGGKAFLRKQEFVVPRVPRVEFDGKLPQPDGGRHWPFKDLETTALTTPPLVANPDPVGDGHWVQLHGGVKFQWPLVLTSHGGYRVTASLPMVFVPSANMLAFEPAQLQNTINAYNAAAVADRTLHFGGQKLSFVPPVGEDPALPTFDMVVAAQAATASTFESRQLAAFPAMTGADVHLEALDAVNAQARTEAITEAGPVPTRIEWEKVYTDNDFGGALNAGEVWAKVLTPPNLAVPQDVGGGLAAPALSVEGLSRAHGPVSDALEIAKGNFNPKNYFPADDITLLGGVALREVIAQIPAIPDPRAPEGENVPKVIVKRGNGFVDTIITWRPTLKDAAEGLFEAPKTDADKRLDLKAVYHTDLGTGQTTTTVTGEIRNFALNFVGTGTLGFVRQPVTRLRFESRNGGRPDLDLQLGKPSFLGDLRFLDALKDYLPALPGGVKIDLTPRGLAAGLNIAIPAVAIGVVMVRNLSIGVLLDLPFNGDQAVLTFNFATREQPFQLTVSALGGGGFLAIGLGTREVQQVEGALEFGAAVAIDLGVASGSVSIMAGIYFKFAQRQLPSGGNDGESGSTLVITGYVRAVGKLDVLGLIHVSIEFYLGLTYLKETGKQGRVQGVATLSVRVEVLCFSKTVSVTMRKEFSAGPDPTFGQQITAGDWSTYCAAFASS